jgi:hypothetical protein
MKTADTLIDKARIKLNYWQSQMDNAEENSKQYEISKAYRQKYADTIFYLLSNPNVSKMFSFLTK